MEASREFRRVHEEEVILPPPAILQIVGEVATQSTGNNQTSSDSLPATENKTIEARTIFLRQNELLVFETLRSRVGDKLKYGDFIAAGFPDYDSREVTVRAFRDVIRGLFDELNEDENDPIIGRSGNTSGTTYELIRDPGLLEIIPVPKGIPRERIKRLHKQSTVIPDTPPAKPEPVKKTKTSAKPPKIDSEKPELDYHLPSSANRDRSKAKITWEGNAVYENGEREGSNEHVMTRNDLLRVRVARGESKYDPIVREFIAQTPTPITSAEEIFEKLIPFKKISSKVEFITNLAELTIQRYANGNKADAMRIINDRNAVAILQCYEAMYNRGMIEECLKLVDYSNKLIHTYLLKSHEVFLTDRARKLYTLIPPELVPFEVCQEAVEYEFLNYLIDADLSQPLETDIAKESLRKIDILKMVSQLEGADRGNLQAPAA